MSNVKRIWITHFYGSSLPERNNEINKCLKRTAENEHIHRLFVFSNEQTQVEHGEKVLCEKPPTLQQIFDFVNATIEPGNIVLISNADIYPDDTIKLVDKMSDNHALALTRWHHLDPNNEFSWYRIIQDSQDTFVMKTPIRPGNFDYQFGSIGGSDNKTCYELYKAGYDVINPSLIIRTHHLHFTGCVSWMDIPKHQPPYMFVWPTGSFNEPTRRDLVG